MKLKTIQKSYELNQYKMSASNRISFLSPNSKELQKLILLIYLFINSLFIWKCGSRLFSSSSILVGINLMYCLGVWGVIFIFRKYSLRKIKFNYVFLTLVSLLFFLILFLLFKIDRYDLRVDRWSAVTFFIDAVFDGTYPYGALTHNSTTNYPSPFPIWYLLNLPFYLMGDVGYGLIFYIILFLTVVHRYIYKSFKKTTLLLLLIMLSPSYWWEVAVRSDGLSNVIVVLIMLILYHFSGKTLVKDLIVTILLIALLSATRFSAMLPLSIYFFSQFWRSKIKIKIIFLAGVLLILFVVFSPFVFWDTESWVFFKRNPFMSQSSVGSSSVLLFMILVGIVCAFIFKNFEEFIAITGLFLFTFMALSILSVYLVAPMKGFFNNSSIDISYFSLSLVYLFVLFPIYSDTNSPPTISRS